MKSVETEKIMDEREIDHTVPMTRDHVSKVLGVSLSSIDRMKRRGILELSGRIGNVVIFEPGSVSQAKEFLKMREWFSRKGQEKALADGKPLNDDTITTRRSNEK